MKCIVKGYYNTGFNFNNVPDSPALLETVLNVKTFDSVYVKQDRDIINLRLATTYNDIKDIDYLSISTSDETIYYFVLSVNMVNDNVANLTPEQLDELDDIISDIYESDPLTDTQINDLFWFDFELICEWLGIDVDEDDDEE